MKSIRYALLRLLFLIAAGLMACSVVKVNDSVQGQVSETAKPTLLPSATLALMVSHTPTAMPPATLTPTPAVTNLPNTAATDLISSTTQVDSATEPILIATISPDPYRESFLPENVWWSGDNQTLFYQNIETQQAWAYDLATGSSSPIPYVPRAFRELAPEIKVFLPEESTIYSISPRNNYVLFKTPLAEPVPLTPPRFEATLNPAYTFELWLRKDRQDFKLGLVDDCFGLLSPPIWSANENRAVVNTYGTLDVSRACMHDSWLVDTEVLSVGPLSVPWEGVRGYSVRDLSEDGQLLLVRADINYLYNLETKELLTIPGADTDRAILIESDERPTCLILDLEFSVSILQDHVWRCVPTTGSSTLLATVEGLVSQWSVSPDKKFVAFVVKNDFPAGEFYEDVTPGIWLLALP